MLNMITAGESHGKANIVIIEGFPAGMEVNLSFLNRELRRRQRGFGRGNRMKIEEDKVIILSGIRGGRTTGSPIAFMIENKDFKNWKNIMNPEISSEERRVLIPRPGHADLSGYLKYGVDDIRDILERSSARETVSRVAAGGLFKMFLRRFGVKIYSHTISIGNIKIENRKLSPEEADNTALRCTDPVAEKKMISLIKQIKEKGDTLGGVSEIVAENIPVGLGSHTFFKRRLDAKIGEALFSIPSVKGVEIGKAFENSGSVGSQVHDEIFFGEKGFYRKTNRAGGIEGGISNGENIVVRIAIKPIPTLMKPLGSVNVKTKEEAKAHVERSDTVIVPSAGVIGEAMLSYVLTDAFLEKFGGDNISDIEKNFENYLRRIKENGF